MRAFVKRVSASPLLTTLCIILIIYSYVFGLYIGYIDWLETSTHSDYDGRLAATQDLDRWEGLDGYSTSISILATNLRVCLLTVILGIISLGVLTVPSMFINGYTLGMFVAYSLRSYGIIQTIKLTLPHCVEIIGLILSSYVGVALSMAIFFKVYICSRKKLIALLLLTVLLICIGAFIESYITMGKLYE